MSTELAPRAEGVVKEVLARVAEKAAKTLEGLYLKPDDPDFNPDADKTWAECSMRTRAALVIAKGAQEHGLSDGKVLGIVFLQGRARSQSEWEAEAKRVDIEERQAIEAKVVG